MAFVVDASIAGCWAFGDEQDSRADAAFGRLTTEEAIVPSLWWFEVRNILLVNERRQRIAESETHNFLRTLSRLRIRVDREPDESGLLHLARSRRLSVYDAAYLELAMRERVPLATLDLRLSEAARIQGVELVTYEPDRSA